MTGEELAAIRAAAGLSQVELAQRAGIGRHAVSYWECRACVDLRAWAIGRMREVLPIPVHRYSRKPPPPARNVALARMDADLARRSAEAKAREAARAVALYVRCGAKTRKGTPCRLLSERGKRRCKFHGGRSTGARTPEGIERIRKAQRLRWARWRALAEGGRMKPDCDSR